MQKHDLKVHRDPEARRKTVAAYVLYTEGSSYPDVASVMGISESTARRWVAVGHRLYLVRELSGYEGHLTDPTDATETS